MTPFPATRGRPGLPDQGPAWDDPAARPLASPAAGDPAAAPPLAGEAPFEDDLFGDAGSKSQEPSPDPGPGRGAVSSARPLFLLPPLLPQRDLAAAGADPQPGAGPSAPGCNPLAAPVADYVPVRALEDVLALRYRQIHEFGHTLERDLAEIAASGKRHLLAQLARQALTDAVESMMFNKDRDQVRRKLVKAGALTLAAIDAEDARDLGDNGDFDR